MRANTIHIYRREDGKYDWKAIGGNATDIVATSGGQGFERVGSAIDSADQFGPRYFDVAREDLIVIAAGDRQHAAGGE